MPANEYQPMDPHTGKPVPLFTNQQEVTVKQWVLDSWKAEELAWNEEEMRLTSEARQLEHRLTLVTNRNSQLENLARKVHIFWRNHRSSPYEPLRTTVTRLRTAPTPEEYTFDLDDIAEIFTALSALDTTL